MTGTAGLFLSHGWRIRETRVEGVGHVHAQDEDDAHAGAERSEVVMAKDGVPDGTGMLSIGTTVARLPAGMDEAQTLLFPRRKQRKKQRI
jgi:hypothetical protein